MFERERHGGTKMLKYWLWPDCSGMVPTTLAGRATLGNNRNSSGDNKHSGRMTITPTVLSAHTLICPINLKSRKRMSGTVKVPEPSL